MSGNSSLASGSGSWLGSWLSSSGSRSPPAFCFLGYVRVDLALQSFFAFLLPIVQYATQY